MAKIINLKQARKNKDRARARKAGDEKALLHGITKSEKARQSAELSIFETRLDNHKRDD